MTNPARILIVDDCPIQTLMLTVLLEPQGYAVSAVKSGEQALAQLHTTSPDLILLDNILPGISGVETYQRIRAVSVWSTIPIIMVTGQRPDEQGAARAAGIEHFLPKPPPAEDLQACIAALLSQAVPAAPAA